ncbi:putative vacuolar protein sorting-associated protein vps4 [Cardiosporidium cionae]|uniref:Vacuolar protein sorting-associated protein vps4 n=1 Tax=Cardiosporidium cionae TaxID=476202 RepID=A0ABQ7J9W8_9APIC|nr:putative vacuolar protein sorting-associated protein vps4 [Cardiosporidium cionae]|eukprot:KAF8820767.1 putative vacuolar protein sorting-associated protein vps4 [Cardiosporidium cionae]
MENERLQKALNFSQVAAEKDRAGLYAEAFELYKISLDNWQFVCKYQSNEALKERLYKKMGDIITRAEQLKGFLEAQGNAKTNGPLPAVDDNRKSNGQDGEQKEDDKMKEKLESAIVSEKPNVRWSDIAGLMGAKASLQEAVILPTRFPNLFTGDRKPWKGILLYGPPGTGKTYLAKACATEADGTFLAGVSSADLMSKWQGESEKLVRSLFEMARQKKPAIIFIDEVDSMCSARSDNESESSRRVKTEFLVQMQGMGQDSNGVLVLGASNVPWELDSAIRRRFERRIYIPLPEEDGRKILFHLAVKNTPNNLSERDFTVLAQKTNGFSGADINIVARDALFQPVRKCRMATHFKEVKTGNKTFLSPCSPTDTDSTKREVNLMSIPAEELLPPVVNRQDFLDVLSKTRPSVGPDDLKKHQAWTKQYGLEGN